MRITKILLSIIIFLFLLKFINSESEAISQSNTYPMDTTIVDTAQIDSNLQMHDTVTVVLEYPSIENTAFSVGEKLTFKVRYGFVRAGTATMEVMPDKVIRGKTAYHIQTRAESASGFSWIYKVEDVVDSYMDKMGLFSGSLTSVCAKAGIWSTYW